MSDSLISQPLRRPTFEAIGDLAAYYYSAPRQLIERHVETIDMRDIDSARRRLTIDFTLPDDCGASLPWDGGQRLFYVPITQIKKTPPTTNVDLRDQDGRCLPLFTRTENARITERALWQATREILEPEGRAEQLLEAYSAHLVRATEPSFQRACVASAEGVLRETPRFGDRYETDPDVTRLVRLWHVLATDSIIWLGVVGYPGERRLVKFAYDVSVDRPRLRPIKARRVEQTIMIEGVRRTHSIEYPGDDDRRGMVVRALNRLATTVGWAAYDITISSLYLHSSTSYHLQFTAPDGLEARHPRLRGDVRDHDGRPVRPSAFVDGASAHLYVSRAEVHGNSNAQVSLRVSRRGFLSYATVFCIVIAAMLVFFSRWADRMNAQDAEIAAAVLLIVPALLGVFMLRPGEHTLVGSLLAGVRGVLLAGGVLCAASAAALLGVLPFGLAAKASDERWSAVEDAWHWYSLAAVGLACTMLVSWVLALDSVETLRTRTRTAMRGYAHYSVAAAALLLANLGLLQLAETWGAGPDDIRNVTYLVATTAIAASSAWLALFPEAPDESARKERSRFRIAYGLSVNSVVSLSGGLALMGWDFNVTSWTTVQTVATYVMLALMGVLLAQEIFRLTRGEDPNR